MFRQDTNGNEIDAMPNSYDIQKWSKEKSSVLKSAREISMLGLPALALLKNLARQCEGNIIELGPYVGGSCIALASGVTKRVVSVEIGGPNFDHDSLATKDIVTDLKANLDKAGFTDRVAIIEGHFRSANVFADVKNILGSDLAKMIFIDIHPATELALCLYSSLLQDRAFVVIDDYSSDIAVEKAAAVSKFVDMAVSRGILEEYGVFGWGTWFGRLTGEARRLLELSDEISLPSVKEEGHCWQIYAGLELMSDDKTGSNSPLRLMEDDDFLGPGHCLHDDIRKTGGGQYSHWTGNLWFSTSDNTDPGRNGRQYKILLDGDIISLGAPNVVPGSGAGLADPTTKDPKKTE